MRNIFVYVYIMLKIYYDYIQGYGVNATCPDWKFPNDFFKSWGDFVAFVDFHYGDDVELIEITVDNYDGLCDMGVFNECRL